MRCPPPPAERVDVLDALRGLALFGILLANILYWSGWSMVTDAQRLHWAGADVVLWQYRFHHLLVDGKFYTVFSLLFGVGFALQLERLARRGHDGLRIYRRRVLVLLGIGLVHSYLIWDGDILTLYALKLPSLQRTDAGGDRLGAGTRGSDCRQGAVRRAGLGAAGGTV